MTRLRSRIPLPVWGLIGIALFVIVAYLVFGGRAGFGGQSFELRAVFRSEAQLMVRSPVRIAGIDVGTVTEIEPIGDGSGAAVVTMQIDDKGLPIHVDSTVKIRSRLLLEGNFYIELSPGTPAAGQMKSGDTIAAASTSGPVQLDRVLSDLPAPTRKSLRTTLQGFGQAIGGEPGAPAPDEDPATEGETAGEALNDSLEYLPDTLVGSAQTADALLGLEPGDLANAIRGESRILSALADRETALADLITGFNSTMGAFASQQSNVRAALGQLPRTLERAGPALESLNAALPETRAFARELQPSIVELPATMAAAGPWIEQTRALLSPDELGGLAATARPAVAKTAAVLDATEPLLGQADLISRCFLNSFLPTSETAVEDPPLSTGVPVYREFFQTFVGVVSAAQNFDGNGVYVRGQPGGGAFPVTTSELESQGPLRGNATRLPLGTRPAYPGKTPPPLRTDATCAAQAPPDLNAKTGVGP